MRGKKITRADFLKNYVNVDESEINRPAPEFEPRFINEGERMIYNPVRLFYYKAVGETEKAVQLQFENGAEEWFSKALMRINTKKKEIVIPRNFAEERKLLEYEVEDGKQR